MACKRSLFPQASVAPGQLVFLILVLTQGCLSPTKLRMHMVLFNLSSHTALRPDASALQLSRLMHHKLDTIKFPLKTLQWLPNNPKICHRLLSAVA